MLSCLKAVRFTKEFIMDLQHIHHSPSHLFLNAVSSANTSNQRITVEMRADMHADPQVCYPSSVSEFSKKWDSDGTF
jgi:hypothetical protein